MKRSKTSDECVFLFTSTIRPQYVSDALDVMASPEGSEFRFRYQRKYVDPDLAKRWESSLDHSLVGKRVLVVFAIQHPDDFYQPSYIPIRDGVVTQHFVEGDTFVINFESALLRLPKKARTLPSSKDLGAMVQAFSSEMRNALRLSVRDQRPSAIAAKSLDELLAPLEVKGPSQELQQGSDFQVLVSLMAAALYIDTPKFFRISKIEKHSLTNGRLKLVAGSRVRFSITHYQMKDPSPGAEIEISVPNGMTLLGDATIPLPSKYDVIPLDVFVAYRDDTIEGRLTIISGPSSVGPRVEIPVVIAPSKVPLLTTGGAVAGATASGASGIIIAGTPTKVFLIALGSALAGLAVYIRRSRGLS